MKGCAKRTIAFAARLPYRNGGNGGGSGGAGGEAAASLLDKLDMRCPDGVAEGGHATMPVPC